MKKSSMEDLVKVLELRFKEHMSRHEGVDWKTVEAKLENNPAKLTALLAMENSGGEPDVISYDKKTGVVSFCDCAPESPIQRRSLCYDRKALDARKENKPSSSAVEMAAAMGIELLSEAQYRELQEVGEFDTKTSSWVLTPDSIRKQGGAVFCDRRYDHVFLYHNGAESYYAARGFRGMLKL